MDRRKFIKTGVAAVAAAELTGVSALAAEPKDKKQAEVRITKGPFSSEKGKATDADIKVRFLGTGAADWNGRDDRGEQRRLTSILVDDKILFDVTPTPLEMLPEGVNPKVIFYTHSHSDHYNPKTAVKLGLTDAYMSETWSNKAKWDFKSASADPTKVPEIHPLKIGQSVVVEGIKITALPANHASTTADEQALIYLLEKGAVRLIYATDTGGIMAHAARIAGIDAHRDGEPITGIIMEATMGMAYEEDFRIFTHSSVGTVLRTVNAMVGAGRYSAPEGQPAYITHLSRAMHGTQKELDKTLPYPLRAAYDGLEVIFRA